MVVTVSKRLSKIAELVPVAARVVDVGTDHALLPIYLIQQRVCDFVVATDVARGPYLAARDNVERAGLGHRISVRLGNGLSTVTAGEVDAIVIAGMGGAMASDILAAAPDVVRQARRLIVQPMNAAHLVRERFLAEGFGLYEEAVVHEDGRFYEILAADRSIDPQAAYERYRGDAEALRFALEFGPRLLASRAPIVVEYMKVRRQRLAAIHASVQKSVSEAAALRQQQIDQQLARLDDWLRSAEEGETSE